MIDRSTETTKLAAELLEAMGISDYEVSLFWGEQSVGIEDYGMFQIRIWSILELGPEFKEEMEDCEVIEAFRQRSDRLEKEK